MFDKRQIKKLEPYENYFETAVNGNYVRSIPMNDITVIKETWEAASGEKENAKMTCGACQLNFVKKVGRFYFADKERIKAQEKKNGKKKTESRQPDEQ